jgi:hypothetical protein
MNRVEIRPTRRGAGSIAALLLAFLALGIAAAPAGAVAVINTALAEDWANTYAEKQCNRDAPDCFTGWAARCRQGGKFQVTCYVYKSYEVEPTEGLRELWDCHRRIRYTVDRRPWYRHKRWISHSRLLGPWICGAHRRVRDF